MFIINFRILDDYTPTTVDLKTINSMDNPLTEAENDAIFGQSDDIVPIKTVTEVANEKQVINQRNNEIIDDEEGTLICSNYFDQGFSCVLEEACASNQNNEIVLFQGDIKNPLDATFRDEISSFAKCQESGTICCYNEDIL